jgi:two-component system chemotaxis response regulator CheB
MAPDRIVPINVLIVDDSRVFRTAVRDALTAEADLVIAGSERNGVRALDFLRANPVDVVTLDIEMPEMDGLEALKAIAALNQQTGRRIGVIMLSAFTREGAEQTIKALAAGAFDFIAKPVADGYDENVAALRRQLASRIRACHAALAPSARRIVPAAKPVMLAPAVPAVPIQPRVLSPASPAPQPRAGTQAVLIGVSTGGPKALMQMLPVLCRKVSLPILIVQHMPPKFTASLAESLGRICSHRVEEATDGMPVEPGRCYIAPGGRHMVVRRTTRVEIGINDQPPEGGLRPAVDLLFRSAAPVFDGRCVAVVLTGMGSDGTKGLAPLKRGGVPVICQDEATSVVWGMPGAAVAAGLADQVLPLDSIPDAVARLIR